MSFFLSNDTSITYTYSNAFFKPQSMRIKNGADIEYYAYDESGNVWLDRRSMSAYTINALGLPSKTHLFSKIPGTLSSDQLARDEWVESRTATTEMAYDEGGQRIWTKFVANAPSHTTEVTYPGIGEYKYSGRNYSNDLELARIDLLGGGYRTGLNGEAVFPVKDLQGSVRGYVNKSGLKSAFGYRPYGTTIDLARYASDDDRRWQGKELDYEHDKLYFGARFYDPFFGLWMSPDPAGQFANPYSYGGDPLNFIDPTGMWALGDGLVFGYDESHGWSLGVGVAAEFENSGVNASYTFNQDGSKSLALNSYVSVCYNGVCYNGGTGFNMNTYTGSSLSRSAGVCFGASSDACAGFELGQGLSWDRSGGFAGMTAYAEVYATFAGVRNSYGYEQGFFGAEGRGMYAGIGGYGLHAEVSHLERGFDEMQSSWGANYTTDIWGYDSQKGFDYIGKGVVDALLEVDEIPHKEHENFRGKPGKWGKTNYCGSGGDGGLTDGVDGGCLAHDTRYDIVYERAKQKGVPKWVRDYFYAGVGGAVLNASDKIVAADIKLVGSSFSNFSQNKEAAIKVGGVFSLFLLYKLPINIAIDLIYHTHPTNRYSWNSSYYNR